METILFIIAMLFGAFWLIFGYEICSKREDCHSLYFDNSDDANKFNAILKSVGLVIHVKDYIKQFDIETNEISIKAGDHSLLSIKRINIKDAMFVFNGKVSITFNSRMLKKMRKVIKIVKIREELTSYGTFNRYVPIFE